MKSYLLTRTFAVATGALLFSAGAAWAELNITVLTTNGTLTWTNSYTNANYRVESATTLAGPWVPVTNLSFVRGSNNVSVQVQTPFSLPLSLYRVVWTDAPPAQPLGTWVYDGYDPSGGLVVTGLVSITASNPWNAMCEFSLIDPTTRTSHPTGSSGINNLVFDSANRLNLQFPDPAFQKDQVGLSGQMVLDEFWGYWSYKETWISLYGPGWVSTVSGRFSARRQN